MKRKAEGSGTSLSTGTPQLGESPGMDCSSWSSEGPTSLGDFQPAELGGDTCLLCKPQTVALARTN